MKFGKFFTPNGGTKLLIIMVASLLLVAGLGYVDFKSEKRRTDLRTQKAVSGVITEIVHSLADSLRREGNFLAANQLVIIRSIAKTHPELGIALDTAKIKQIIGDTGK